MIDARAFGPRNAIQNFAGESGAHGTQSNILLSGQSNYIVTYTLGGGETVFKFYLCNTSHTSIVSFAAEIYCCAFPLSHTRGRELIRLQVSIPVSRFHELSQANRGGAAAKVIRRRNDSLSAIPGYYGRNQFLQMTHSQDHLARAGHR